MRGRGPRSTVTSADIAKRRGEKIVAQSASAGNQAWGMGPTSLACSEPDRMGGEGP